MAKKASFNDGEKKQSVHCSTERIYYSLFLCCLRDLILESRRLVIETFIQVGQILKNKQLSNLSNSGL